MGSGSPPKALTTFKGERRMRIYVASSWKNEYQPEAVRLLRELGHSVYDYRNPAEGDHGFSWREISPNFEKWGLVEFEAALEHPAAKRGFAYDMRALQEADATLLVLPSGKSAHLELGFACGQNQKAAVLCFDPQTQPELMYKMCPRSHEPKEKWLLTSWADLEQWAGRITRPVKVYVAARSQHQEAARVLRETLVAEGFVVTSRWLDMNIGDFRPEEQAKGATIDLEDVDAADVTVFFNPEGFEKVGTGGCHFECGYTLAKSKPVFVYGQPTNVFHYSKGVKTFLKPGALIEALKTRVAR